MSQFRWQLIAILKASVLVLVLVVAILLFISGQRARSQTATPTVTFGSLMQQGAGSTILTIPYQQTLYKHFGNALNPQVILPVKTPSGYKELTFLIDSGAVVSALPQTMALELGTDITKLPRITIEGFASQKTFAYKGEFVVVIGNEEVPIPVVFSENSQASNILGRIGFFDNFNINFDANTESIIISKKG